MTALPAEPRLALAGRSRASRWLPLQKLARFKPWLYHRWLQLPLLLGIAIALFYDRYNLCRQYLFRYTDEDQTIMWNAAHELLNGRLREPAFFGQDYNSCLEGYLAAPLIAAGLPYHVAVPLMTVLLGLLPFVLLALVAWRRGQSLVAGAALLLPLLLSTRYAIITGIPRGFVTGVAIAIFPALLLLPPAARRTRPGPDGAEPLPAPHRTPKEYRKNLSALRYFFAALLSLAAIQINPNCLILLVPVGVYALLTRWREWRFWAFGAAGLLAGAPYLIYCYQFYYIYHPDYVSYLRGVEYNWSYAFYNSFFNQYVAPHGGPSPILMDLVPFNIAAESAPLFLVTAFSLVGGLLLLRNRAAALAAAFAGALFMFATFGYERVLTRNGGNSASFPYGRMYLALPVVWLWLLLLVNHRPWLRFANTPIARWLTRGALAGMLAAAIHAYHQKQAQLPGVLANELRSAMVCAPVPVEEIYALAHEVQKTANANNADLLIVGGGDKWIAYALPAITSVETLYLTPQNFERRTWRLAEETTIKRNNVLLINYDLPGARQVGGGISVMVDANGDQTSDPATPPPFFVQPQPGRGPGNFGGPGRGGQGRGGPGGPGGRGGPEGRGSFEGRGGGRGRGLSLDPSAANPYLMDKPHAVTIPPISMISVGNRPLYSAQLFQQMLPPLIPPHTAANPWTYPQFFRPNWGGR